MGKHDPIQRTYPLTLLHTPSHWLLGRVVTCSQGIPCPAPTPSHTIYLSELIERKKIKKLKKSRIQTQSQNFGLQEKIYSFIMPIVTKLIYFSISNKPLDKKQGWIGCFFLIEKKYFKVTLFLF
jgi:hypothetical protein